jgi:hypothetical protein
LKEENDSLETKYDLLQRQVNAILDQGLTSVGGTTNSL